MKRNSWSSLLVSACLLTALVGNAPAQGMALYRPSALNSSETPLATYIVNTNADSIDGSCSPSKCSLRDAVTAANATSGAIISVPDDTYTLTHGALDITSSMTISGTSLANTIVDGGRADRVFNVLSGTVTISGMTIQHGYSPGVGGGIVASGSLTLNKVKLYDNHAANSGGGIVAWTSGTDGTLTLNDSTVVSNTATFGGGISSYNTPNWIIINNSTVISNVASSGAGIDSLGPLTVTQSAILDNFSTNIAGGIRSLDGGALISSTVSGNQSHNLGAGLYLGGPSAPVDVTFTIQGSTISNNSDLSGSGSGGGINMENTNVTVILVNSTVSGNKVASLGGGLYNPVGLLKLYNTTVSDNSAAQGGGIYIGSGVNNATQPRNSLIAGNTASISGPDCFGTMDTQGYNLVQNMAGCPVTPAAGDISGVNARLGPLQNNGGATSTHALLVNSPAINAGDPGGCVDSHSLALASDQRGEPRPYAGSRCDIGSYEYSSVLTKAVFVPLIEK
jgi:CSLREA domain-containing protein